MLKLHLCKKNQHIHMKLYHILILIILSFSSYGQDMKNYTGSWQGKIADKNAFNLIVSIQKQINGNSQFVISNEHEIINKQFTFENEIQLSLDDNLTFKGIVNNEQSEINGFIKSGMLFYHIKLKKEGDTFIGKWNILMIDYLKSQSLYLSVENGSEDEYQAYQFGEMIDLQVLGVLILTKKKIPFHFQTLRQDYNSKVF